MAKSRHRTWSVACGLGLLVYGLTACTSSSSVNVTAGANGSLIVRGDPENIDSVPSCNWPVEVSGQASRSRVGLVRCYLRALARRELHGLAPLTEVTGNDTPVTLTSADLKYAPDAAHGTTRAVFTLNGVDPFDGSVELIYADRTRESVQMDALNVNEPASRSWRLDIGTTPPDASGPPATVESP